MSVYAPMLASLWRYLEAHGHDPTQAIDPRDFHPGKKITLQSRVRLEDYDAAQVRAAELLRDPAVGLRTARYLHPSHIGALGHAFLSSPCLRSALRRAERFTRMLHDFLRVDLVEQADRVVISYVMEKQPSRPDLMADALLAGVFAMCRMNYGNELLPLRVDLVREAPGDPTEWHEVFGIRVHFGQQSDSLTLAAEDADTPLTGSNSELLAIHEEIMNRHLLRLDRENVVQRARLAIMETLPSGGATEEEIARSLNMSKRTLHRKLRESSETFRSLLKEVRLDLAKRYLADGDYGMTEIAFLLGYSDTSAFSRAFRGWTEHSPSEAREALRNELTVPGSP